MDKLISGCSVYMIAIYLRLSKDDDLDDESLSISNQRMILNDYIQNLFGISVQVFEYIDDGYSGMNNLRPALTRMLEDIQNRKINCVIVKDCSRLARKNSLISYYVEELFYEENIRFISLLENFDNTIDRDTEKIMLPGFFNEYHVKTTSKKVRATKESLAKKGLFCGGFAPYGYVKDPNNKHKLLIDPYAAEIVKYIFNEFLSGTGLVSICNKLTDRGIKIPSEYKGMNRGLKSSHYGIWTSKTISDMLHNPTYAGHLTQHREKAKNISSKKKVKRKRSEWITVPNSCPAIVKQDVFDKVQITWTYNKSKQRKNHDQLLNGFMFCKECGHTIGIKASTWKNKDGTIRKKYICECNYYRRLYRYNACTPHKLNYNPLEELILKEVKDMCYKYANAKKLEEVLKKQDRIQSQINELKASINFKTQNIESIHAKNKNLYEDKLSGFIDAKTYLAFKEKFTKEINLLREDITKIEEKLYQLNNKLTNRESKYTSIVKEFLTMNNMTKDMLAQLIEKILIDENLNIEIYYRIKPLLV